MNGVKNYFGGWWMPKFDSWFFKSQYLDVLLSHGATLSDSTSTSTPSSGPLQGMLLEPYKRGLLLVPSSSHPDVGQKSYHGGWWMPSHDAWIFKKTAKKSLNINGCRTCLVIYKLKIKNS